MRIKLRSRLMLLFMSLAMVLALPAMALADASLDTSADLSTSASTPTNAQIGSNAFKIKIWATGGNVPAKQDGKAYVGTSYSMATNGTITANQSATQLAQFDPGYNYSTCPATAAPKGCPTNPFEINATLNVAEGTPDGRAGTLTVYNSAASSSGLTADGNPAQGQVKVVAPKPAKQDQTITFNTIPTKTYGDAAFNVNATASSSLPVSYQASGTCSVSGNTVTITGVGNCDVTASQAGNDSYNAAPNVARTFDIAQAPLTIKADDAEKSYGDPNPQFSGSIVSGLKNNDQLSVSTSSQATANSDVGTYPIVPSLSGDNAGNYQVTAQNGTLTIKKATQTINNFGQIDNKTYGDANFQVSAKASSGLLVSFSADGSCSVTGNTVSITGAGNCTITASQAGNGNYNAAQNVQQSFQIAKANATIDVNGFDDTYDGKAHGATGTATGVDGSNLNSLLNLGASFTDHPGGTANWSFAGDANHKAASGSVAISIDKAATTTTVSCEAGPFTYDGSAQKPCSASVLGAGGLKQSLPVGYQNNVNAGQATASASYDESANHTGSRDSKTFNIAKADLTVTADAKSKVFGEADPALTYQHAGALFGNDQITGSLTRAAGEAVGSHAIQQGSVTAGNNYAIKYVGANLTIGAWNLKGFHSPIGVSNSIGVAPGGSVPQVTPTTAWQTAKGGSTIPLKFNVFAGAVEKTATTDIQSFNATKLSSCTASTVNDPVDELSSAGSSSLRYDATDGQFIQNWKTSAVSGDTCYRVAMTAKDGSAVYTFIKLRK